MKHLTRALIAFSLLMMALCLMTACGEKLPADYLDGTDVVIDNETPFVYAPETDVKITLPTDGWECSVLEYVAECCSTIDDATYRYQSVSQYFGNKPVRELVKDDETLYYTVYSLTDHSLLYLYFETSGDDYICSHYFTADGREDDVTKDFVLPQDLPTAILGDKLPKRCYLDYYSQDEIIKRNKNEWAGYYHACNTAQLPHNVNADPEGNRADDFIRCIELVTFDIDPTETEGGYSGMYVYDAYVYEDGTGSLYFYHLCDKNYLPSYTYTLLQKEIIPLTSDEVTALMNLLDTWNFADQPTWNPEEMSGTDGSSTLIYATYDNGENLISMWEPTARYPHYHIRTAIEDLVRAHVTVEEGRVYRLELYE